MVDIVSKEEQQKILKHIRKHGCKVYFAHPKEGLTQAHLRICLERNLSGEKVMMKASSFADIITEGVPFAMQKQRN
ncbi:MAG: hypothetical protein E7013_00140 [Alphaproteobacteria bacterium]|nr:hypothetical protein [Alphaproteobacteria bacterium]